MAFDFFLLPMACLLVIHHVQIIRLRRQIAIIHLIWKDLKLHICSRGKESSVAVFGADLISPSCSSTEGERG